MSTPRSVLVASLLTFTVPAALILAVLTVTWFVASSASGWAGIGYAYIGLVLAVLAGAVAIPVAARMSFARALPPGARLRPALACALTTAAALLSAGGRIGVAVIPTTWALTLLPLPFLLPLALASHLRWRWVVAPVVVLAASTLTITGVQNSAQRGREDDEHRESLARFGPTLPLVQGQTLQSPRPGWELISVSIPTPTSGMPVNVLWRSDVGTAAEVGYQLEVTQTPTDCFAEGATCTVIGNGPHGPVSRYQDASYVFVTVESVEWQLTGADATDAVQVLNEMKAVEAGPFTAAADDAQLKY